MKGTGGSLRDPSNNAGSAVLGTTPTNWRVYKGQTDEITVTCTSGITDTVTIAGQDITIPVLKVVIAAGGTGRKAVTLEKFANISTGFAASDKVRMGCYIKQIKNVGLTGISPTIQERVTGGVAGKGTSALGIRSLSGVDYLYPADLVNGPVVTPSLQLASDVTAIKQNLIINVDGATADCEFNIGLVSLRKVA